MSRAPIKNLFMALILAFTGLTGADILAADIYKESGDYACRGNLLTPEEARRNQLTGDVRLVVALYPDGSIKRIDVLASSGKSVLDQAAIRSVSGPSSISPTPPG